MTSAFTRIEALTPPPSLARVHEARNAPVRVALIQHAWRENTNELATHISEGIAQAAEAGAQIVFLPELTLSRYPADALPEGAADAIAEDLLDGPTFAFAAAAARDSNVYVHASLYQKTGDADGRGLNTAIIVSPAGELVAQTHKLHIPVTAGYYEDKYFRAGPADGSGFGVQGDNPYPVYEIDGLEGARFGLPTCWDEWFPEVARSYSLGGANIVVYPTAIGSEPDHPDFDTKPLWQQVIVGNGIANALFMIVPNRTGAEKSLTGEPSNTFYGGSFISDPYGRILAEAPRDEEAIIVADLDLEQRSDWLDLFPFLATRRPDTYGALGNPVITSTRNGAVS